MSTTVLPTTTTTTTTTTMSTSTTTTASLRRAVPGTTTRNHGHGHNGHNNNNTTTHHNGHYDNGMDDDDGDNSKYMKHHGYNKNWYQSLLWPLQTILVLLSSLSSSSSSSKILLGGSKSNNNPTKLKRAILMLIGSVCVLLWTLWHTSSSSLHHSHHPHGHHGTHPSPTNHQGNNHQHNNYHTSNVNGGRDDDKDDDRHGGGHGRHGATNSNRGQRERQRERQRQREERGGGGGHQRQQRRRRRQEADDATDRNEKEENDQDGSGDNENENNDGEGNFPFSDNTSNQNRNRNRDRIQQYNKDTLKKQLKDLNKRIHNNEDRGIVWARMDLVPALNTKEESNNQMAAMMPPLKPLLEITNGGRRSQKYFRVSRRSVDNRHHSKTATGATTTTKQQPGDNDASNDGIMAWERHDEETKKDDGDSPTSRRPDFVDYTTHPYSYPEKLSHPPDTLGEYPKLIPLKQMMKEWPQDELDHPPSTIEEVLIHFDYNKPEDRQAAIAFREAKLPFKVINVPEVLAAGEKWTDEYVSRHFDTHPEDGVMTDGQAQESPSNFFAWFQPTTWNVEKMGLPPTRNNNWSYAQWAKHAKYADRVGLSPNRPHFYWQAGADKEERHLDPQHWTFISKDLPSFSSTTENFFLFEPQFQKGIQCRFGERGVTAATHFDGGRNMVAMIHGAKRYILSPPRECRKLGIVTTRGNAIFRHSMLNFGHINHIDDPDMPEEERHWMEESGNAMALSTVLKAGEVLYIPSHWFHYITSLQKSSQCNVRSGVDVEGDEVFGGEIDVTERCVL